MSQLRMSVHLIVLAAASVATPAPADDHGPWPLDFGASVERQLEKHSSRLFGVRKPLQSSFEGHVPRSPDQSPTDVIALAGGLEAAFVSRAVAHKWDQMVLWPSDANPTHLVACIEEFNRQVIGEYPDGFDKYNPSVQRLDLETGEVTTVLRGMAGCDGIRRTDWGTILVTEEDGRLTEDGHLGGAYEILDPLTLTEGNLTTRQGSEVYDPHGDPVEGQVAYRAALPTMAWEGLTVLPDGVVIAGDELRPGTSEHANGADADGGAIFKFIPAVPRTGGAPITNLDDSPLVAGSVYALQVSCRDDRQQYGQGCEVGNGAWIPVDAANARFDADALGVTGYYRPEDLHRDPSWTGPGVRFCWTNTGNEDAGNYGEVLCGVDASPATADPAERQVTVNRLLEGDPELNQPDNLAFQPRTGNVYVIEDHPNGDVWACLPDGADRDIKSDGCVRILSVKDATAEPTGFFFAADGRSAWVSIQHSADDAMPMVDDWPTDDLLRITGFGMRRGDD